METQKIANLLGDEGNESSKSTKTKWYVINDQNNTDHGVRDEVSRTVTFETKVIKSNLYDYSDTYILATGGITVDRNNNVEAAFKNCAPFRKCITHIDNANNLDITMPMYNLIEYSDNYSDTSGSLWQFKRPESPVTDAWKPWRSYYG